MLSKFEQNQIIQTLQLLELDDLEIKLYLHLWQNKDKKNSIISLSKIFTVSRNTIYKKLEILNNVNLIIYSKNIKFKNITINHPSIIKSLLKKQEYKIMKYSSNIENIISKMTMEYSSSDSLNNKIQTFDGENNFFYLFNSILDNSSVDIIYSFNENDDLYEVFDINYFFDVWVKNRIQSKVYIKVIAGINNSRYEESKKDEGDELRETKQLNQNIKGSYWIVNKSVIFWDTKNIKAYLIENEIVADMLKSNFKLVWDSI